MKVLIKILILWLLYTFSVLSASGQIPTMKAEELIMQWELESDSIEIDIGYDDYKAKKDSLCAIRGHVPANLMICFDSYDNVLIDCPDYSVLEYRENCQYHCLRCDRDIEDFNTILRDTIWRK